MGSGFVIVSNATKCCRSHRGQHTAAPSGRISPTESFANVTKPVFKLWLDLGTGPTASAGESAGYAVFPRTAGAGAAEAALTGVEVLANTPTRQVVSVAGGGGSAGKPGPRTIMAVVHAAGPVLAAGDSPSGHGRGTIKAPGTFGLESNSSVLLVLQITAGAVNFSFSHPTLPSGAVVRLSSRDLRLTGRGRGAVGCATTGVGGANSVSTVGLTLPALVGSTAVGGCDIASPAPSAA